VAEWLAHLNLAWFFSERGSIMSRRIGSPWRVFAGADAKHPSRPHPLRVERLEERLVLDGGYQQTNLVSDIPGMARHTDSNLVNPWGINVGPDGQVRVSDNGTGLSTAYTGNGKGVSPVVTIPPPMGSPPGTTAAPTGNVLNTTGDFVISEGHRSRPSSVIFATEDGTISGWNPEVDRNNAILKPDNSPSGAVYKGLALGRNAQGNFLFATNFHAGTIDVFDKNFHQVHLAGSFIDPNLPPPPIGTQGFAPFGIENIGGNLFVTYSFQKPGQHDDLAGAGNGFIDVFDTSGNFLKRFASHGTLNSPWGLAVAPDDFGKFSHDLLVGNFGDGRINAFNLTTGAFLGQLSDPAGQPITIDGLWGLTFSRGDGDDDNPTLFFAAGINDEAHGLFGTLRPADDDDPPEPGAVPSKGDPAFAPDTAALVALPPSAHAVAAPITGSGDHSVASSTLERLDAVSARAVSKEAIDQAFGDLQPGVVADLAFSL
jgi:uncharacterized protein (TIGR03118 family)